VLDKACQSTYKDKTGKLKGQPMKRRREKITYNYECTLTAEQYTLTQKAPNPKELVSVKAYYELHPDMDDRPAVIKKKLGIAAPTDSEKH
jgi:hypothetical protein